MTSNNRLEVGREYSETELLQIGLRRTRKLDGDRFTGDTFRHECGNEIYIIKEDERKFRILEYYNLETGETIR